MARIVGEVRPAFVFVENSGGLVGRGLFAVCRDLSLLGYDARWGIFSAEAVGARHQRQRLFLVAWQRLGPGDVPDSDGVAVRDGAERGENSTQAPDCWDSESFDLGDFVVRIVPRDGVPPMHDDWRGWARYSAAGFPQPAVRGTSDALADRMERLRAIGNGQVPAVARLAWCLLSPGAAAS